MHLFVFDSITGLPLGGPLKVERHIFEKTELNP